MPASPHERPLADTLTGWAGDCLALRCRGQRTVDGWGTEDGMSQVVVTQCGKCGRVEIEPAPGFEHPALPGMEDA